LLLGLLLMPACADHKGPPFLLRLAHQPAGGRCVPVGGMPPIQDLVVNGDDVSTLRLTARVHATGDPKGSFACDRVFPVGGTPGFRVPLGMGSNQTIDLYVEAFKQNAPNDPLNPVNGTFRRVAVGSALGLPANLASPTPIEIVLYPTEKFRCADSRLQRARAFHSATVLPNGQVLFYGGVVADPGDTTNNVEALNGNEQLFLTNTAEIYDPTTGKFSPVMDGTPGIGRAFHHAAVVGTTPPYQILVVGGLTTVATADPHSEVLAPNTSQGVGRLYPIDLSNGIAKSQLPTVAAPAEILSYEPTSQTIVAHVPQPAFMSATFQAAFDFPQDAGLAVADGVDFNSMMLNQTIARQQLAGQIGVTAPRLGSTALPRMGATLSPIGDGATALLWGGGTNTTDQIGELVVGFKSGTLMSMMQFPAITGVPMTQFQTATLLDSDMTGTRVLVAGGFAVESTHVNRLPPRADQAVTLVNVTSAPTITTSPVTPVNNMGVSAVDLTCTDPNRYKPAGYQSAVQLARDDGSLRVLVSGGAPSFIQDTTMAKICGDCESSKQEPMCSLSQAWVFSRASGMQPTVEAMQIGRFGHTSTVLPDKTVLVVGGISLGANDPGARMLGDAEVYNPRLSIPPYNATMAATALDADDPVYIDLKNTLGGSTPVVRAPGQQAFQSGAKFPFLTCNDF
jgi:hypothetical protein